MTYAYENEIPVVARGSGTDLVGAAVALEGGIMICPKLMNHILELDENNLTVTVEPGVLLMELQAYVEEKGYSFYPIMAAIRYDVDPLLKKIEEKLSELPPIKKYEIEDID